MFYLEELRILDYLFEQLTLIETSLNERQFEAILFFLSSLLKKTYYLGDSKWTLREMLQGILQNEATKQKLIVIYAKVIGMANKFTQATTMFRFLNYLKRSYVLFYHIAPNIFDQEENENFILNWNKFIEANSTLFYSKFLRKWTSEVCFLVKFCSPQFFNKKFSFFIDLSRSQGDKKLFKSVIKRCDSLNQLETISLITKNLLD